MTKLYNIIFIFIISILFLSCSNDSNISSSNTNNANNLSITRAPSSTTPISTYNTLSLDFSSKLDASSVSTSTVLLKESVGTSVPIEVELVPPSNTKIIVTPYLYLKASTTYSLTVTTGIKNEAGATLSEDTSISFTTLNDSTNPGGLIKLIEWSPLGDSISKAAVTMSFDRFIAPSNNEMFILKDLNTSTNIAGSFEYFNSRVTFTPSSDLTIGHSYEVSIMNIPTDLYGNIYDTSSGMGINFDVTSDLNASGFDLNSSLAFDLGNDAYKMNMAYDYGSGYDKLHVVVASDAGLEFIEYDYNNANYIDKSFPTYSLSSKVTDMIFDDSSGSLIISTLNDGLLKITIDSGVMSVTKSAIIPQNAFGIGINPDGNGDLYRIYTVGPDFGLMVYDQDLNYIRTVSTPGDALQVTGAGPTTFVADYENGIMVYDVNGTLGIRVDLNVTIKDVAFAGIVLATSSSGNMFQLDAGGTVLDGASLASADISEININILGALYISRGDLFTSSSKFVDTSTDIVSALYTRDNPEEILILHSDGILNILQSVDGDLGGQIIMGASPR